MVLKIKYKELGDKKYEDLPPGDLTATVKYYYKIFTQEGDDLKMHLTISAWNAIIGTTIQLKTIEQKILNLNIPSTQYGRILKIPIMECTQNKEIEVICLYRYL